MKKKKLRTAAIALFAIALVGASLLRLNIEPADAPVPSTAIDAPTDLDDAAESTPAIPDSAETSDDALTEAPAEEVPNIPAEEVSENPADAPEPSTDPASSDMQTEEPVSEEPEQHICTLEIRCDTVVDTSKLENQAVAPYVPEDGLILPATEFAFTPGESVFDILLRATREKGIQMEFRDDQLYSGKYIEGINYLYEFDGGPLSGWMYHVNGQFPNRGCAAINVADDDVIVWVYTCDLGVDVGDNSVWW